MSQTSLFYLVNELADGSSNNLILTLIKGMNHGLFDFHIGALKDIDGSLEPEFREAGATIVNFGMEPGRLGLGLLRQIAHYVEAHEIRILHTHVLRPDILGGLAARMAHRPAVISTKHNMAYVRGQQGWIARNLVYWPAMYVSDQIITVTEALRRQAIARLHISPDRVTTIYNGIDADRFYIPDARAETRAGLGIEPDDVVLTYTGRLIGGKGIEELLHALHHILPEHPRCRVLIVGEGELRESLEQLAQDLDIQSRVTYSGFRRDIPEILAASDVFVLPSFSEGLPLSLLEAMAAGLPVIASRVGGIPEVVVDYETGLMIEPGDVSNLAAAIAALIDNPTLNEHIRTRGRQHVQEHFSVTAMVAQYQHLYEAYAAHKPGSQQ